MVCVMNGWMASWSAGVQKGAAPALHKVRIGRNRLDADKRESPSPNPTPQL